MDAPPYPLRLSRRRFVRGAGVTGFGLLAGCGRLPGQAPGLARAPRVTLFAAGEGPVASGPNAAAFREGLHALGYTEGQNVILSFVTGDGREDRLDTLADELNGLAPDVIVSAGEPAIRAAQQATAKVPIIMAVSRDPVSSGLVASLARPGDRITGLSMLGVQLGGKRIDLLREIVPHLSQVTAIGPPASLPEFAEAAAAAQTLGVRLRFLDVHRPEDFARVVDAARSQGADAVMTLAAPLTNSHATEIAELVLAARLPTVHDRRSFVAAGGLLGYGPSIPGLWRRAAYYVDRILKGTKPADLPVEQPTTFDLVINLKTAQALGLTIPQHVLLQATEVIQ
jgi:putative tryptophan/tyrosine transport system substrate-binding protein